MCFHCVLYKRISVSQKYLPHQHRTSHLWRIPPPNFTTKEANEADAFCPIFCISPICKPFAWRKPLFQKLAWLTKAHLFRNTTEPWYCLYQGQTRALGTSDKWAGLHLAAAVWEVTGNSIPGPEGFTVPPLCWSSAWKLEVCQHRWRAEAWNAPSCRGARQTPVGYSALDIPTHQSPPINACCKHYMQIWASFAICLSSGFRCLCPPCRKDGHWGWTPRSSITLKPQKQWH